MCVEPLEQKLSLHTINTNQNNQESSLCGYCSVVLVHLGSLSTTNQIRKMTMSGGGAHNVFVYGSLLADQVVQVLLNRVPVSSPAILPNFHRFSIKGRVYPAILPVEDKTVLGRVLRGITNHELTILDLFEDVEYVRDSVEVSLVDNSTKLQVYAYIWGEKNDPDLYGDWDFEVWKSAHMDEFLKMTEEFVEDMERGRLTLLRSPVQESEK